MDGFSSSFSYFQFFATCCPVCSPPFSASFLTLPLIKKSSPTTKKENWYSQSRSKSLFFITILSLKDHSLLSDNPIKKEVAWQKKVNYVLFIWLSGGREGSTLRMSTPLLNFSSQTTAVHTLLLSSCFETIITFGGSPTAVAAPPIFVKITSAIRTCLGSRLSTSQSLQCKDNEINFLSHG